MLARSRSVRLASGDLVITPVLIPSISSKGFDAFERYGQQVSVVSAHLPVTGPRITSSGDRGMWAVDCSPLPDPPGRSRVWIHPTGSLTCREQGRVGARSVAERAQLGAALPQALGQHLVVR